LKSFENEEVLVIESYCDAIQQVVINTIKVPEVNHLDILKYKAISLFKDKPFYKLVDIFTSGNCQSFQEIFSSNHSLLSQSDFESLLQKMRILTITSVFSTKEAVSFSEISKTLGIEEEEVEAWIVDASSRDLIMVKINQPQKLVVVRHCAKRSFESKDWELLGAKVLSCRENFVSILETVRRAKQANQQEAHI